MQRRPPTPVCKCFLLCRRIYQDTVRQDYVLASPVHQLFPPSYPWVEGLSVFAPWTNAHGSYPVELLVRTLEGEVFWRQRMAQTIQATDPLQVWLIVWTDLGIPFPAPGKYEVALLADGQEVAAETILLHPVKQQRQW
jgi:hypothetical protein